MKHQEVSESCRRCQEAPVSLRKHQEGSGQAMKNQEMFESQAEPDRAGHDRTWLPRASDQS